MKDLSTLLGHPSVAGFEKLLLVSGRPITLVRGGEKKSMGGPLNNNQLHALLKASLSAETMAGFQWGNKLKAEVEGCLVRIILRPEKVIQVEISAATSATTAAPTSTPAPAAQSDPEPAPAAQPEPQSAGSPQQDAEDDPEVAEEVARLTDAENTALIYAPGGMQNEALGQAVETLGFPPRIGERPEAVIEVLKYHEYPVFIMCLGMGYKQDPVYQFLTKMLMDGRRQQFSVLVAPGMGTGNTMLAFSLSVHLVVALDDLGALAETMEKSMTTWKRGVAPLHDFLAEVGRL